MSKFDLNTLPKCGAKTRRGSLCKRLGNIKNGRCKLHGGRSTGAKTTEGKLAVRANPVKHGFAWHINQHIKPEVINNGLLALQMLRDIKNQGDANNHDINTVVSQYRTELESMKYCILELLGADSFILVQSALDAFYKNTDSKHLHFHIYAEMFKAPYFHQQESDAKVQFIHNKKGFKFKPPKF